MADQLVAGATLKACIEQYTAQATTTVEVALQSHIRRMQKNLTAVQRRLSALEKEIQQVKDHQVLVENALHDAARPLKSQISRSETKLRDFAAEALEREAAVSSEFSQALKAGRTHLAEVLTDLLAMQAELHRKEAWLTKAIVRDNECITSAPCRPSKRFLHPPSSSSASTRDTTPLGRENGGGGTPLSISGKEVAAVQMKVDEGAAVKRPQSAASASSLSKARSNRLSSGAADGAPVAPLRPTTAAHRVVATGTGSGSGSNVAIPAPPKLPAPPQLLAPKPPGSVAPFAALGTQPSSQPRASTQSRPRSSSGSRAASHSQGGDERIGFKMQTPTLDPEMSPLTWESEVNAAYQRAQALVLRSSELRSAMVSEIQRGTTKCLNARKMVFDGIDANVSNRMEVRQGMLNKATHLEVKLHALRKVWEKTSSAAHTLVNPLQVTDERQYLRCNIPDGVGHALEDEKSVIREGRRQLKQKCKTILTELIATEKERTNLLAEAQSTQQSIDSERRQLATDNPLSTGLAPKPPRIVGKRVYGFAKEIRPAPFG